MLRLTPRACRRRRADRRHVFPATGPRKGRVALLDGCTNPVVAPSINAAAIRLLTRHGIEVVWRAAKAAAALSCTTWAGNEAALHRCTQQYRRLDCGRSRATGSTPSWSPPRAAGPRSRTTASCCAPTPPMPTRPPASPRSPRTFRSIWPDCSRPEAATSDLHRRLSRPLLAAAWPEGRPGSPEALLARAGFTVREVPEGHLCCGSAGTYNMLQPELARRAGGPQGRQYRAYFARCRGHQQPRLHGPDRPAPRRLPVVHLVELIDWATGGPAPSRARGSAQRKRCRAAPTIGKIM